MKKLCLIPLMAILLMSCNEAKKQEKSATELQQIILDNPFFTTGNEPIDFTAITGKHVEEAVESIQIITDNALSKLFSIKDDERTFDNTMRAMDELYANFYTIYFPVNILANTHPDSVVRNTALSSKTSLGIYINSVDLNEDLYKAVKSYSQSDEAKTLSGFKKKFVKDRVSKFERNGFALSAKDREIFKVLKNDITTLGNQFRKNIASYQDFLIVSEADMNGLPDDYKETRKQNDGTYKIDLSYPSKNPFLKYCKSDKARKELMLKYLNRAYPENIDVLQELLQKRQEMSGLLGYDTYAEYRLEDRMAKTPETVWEFETNLMEDLRAKQKLDINELLAFKNEDTSGSNVINEWESSYYTNLLLKEKYQLDEAEVKQYFAINDVVKGLLSISQSVFDLDYKEIENPSVWHEDVRMFEVYQDNLLKGTFYLDLHPRANKFSHAACFDMKGGRLTRNAYQNPSAALICNFPEATADKPALMPHSEVVTFFHEFGHLLHVVAGTNELFLQSSLEGAFDFIEVPSQLFENWAWNFDALKLFAKHYDTREVLPEALFKKMLAAKYVGSGIFHTRQVSLGTYDLTLYDKYDPNTEESTTDVLRTVQSEIGPYPFIENTHFQAAFGHLYGYGAGYYSYLWSLVYAQDIFSVFEENGIMDKKTGLRYRDIILAKGGTEDELDMVKEFLGRDSNNDAFLKSLGL